MSKTKKSLKFSQFIHANFYFFLLSASGAADCEAKLNWGRLCPVVRTADCENQLILKKTTHTAGYFRNKSLKIFAQRTKYIFFNNIFLNIRLTRFYHNGENIFFLPFV